MIYEFLFLSSLFPLTFMELFYVAKETLLI